MVVLTLVSPVIWKITMRRILFLMAFSFTVAFVPEAFSQNNLRQNNPPNGRGPGAEEAPAGGQLGPQGGAPAAGQNDPNYKAEVSYALGRNFAMGLKEGGVDYDLQTLMAGISDTLNGAQPKWTDQQLEGVMQRFSQEMQQKEATRAQQEAMKNQQEANAFLAQNKGKEGVQTTPTGLQYKVIQQGRGPSPTINDTVKCNYRGTLLNGTEFDSSARQGGPTSFPLKRVIPGWTEALQKMHVGDKWQLYVPAKLAYGMNPPPNTPIEAGSLLVFDIELLDIVKQ
jgi:FKBP-type peptidyl-prolyl cis-trans isomerase FklB